MSDNGHSTYTHTEVTFRRLGSDDAAAVKRLAERDSAREPHGMLLGAELNGRLLAAISTTTGELIADPFHRTAEIVETLRVSVGPANGRPRGARRLVARLRGVSDTRAPLPASSR